MFYMLSKFVGIFRLMENYRRYIRDNPFMHKNGCIIQPEKEEK